MGSLFYFRYSTLMPELPEVHTITDDLKKHAKGGVVTRVVVKSGYTALPENRIFVSAVTKGRIESVRRIAKNIIFELDTGNFVLFHLAMTGRLLLRRPDFGSDKWERVIFELSRDGKKYELRFCDMRRFGKVELLDSAGIKSLEDKYGPEPIDSELGVEDFLRSLQSKNTNIKNALLDQKVISGMGNIYVNDALWMAEIHPETRTLGITPEMAKNLFESSREILIEAIENRGSTLGDKMYVDLFGREGSHQDHFRIYGKEKCPRCGSDIEFIKLNGRGTFFCPACQDLNSQEGFFS